MLATYLTRTTQLLQSPAAPTSLYDTTSLTGWVNVARNQLAGESESIRYLGTINAVAGTQNYNFSAMNTGVSATNGIQGILHVRSILYGVGNGNVWVRPRSFEWFQLYKMANVVPLSAAPQVWAQYAQGSSGSFYLYPIPDIAYVLTCDCVCYPITLVDDTTVEAIPPLWTDAVPYYAAYLALLSAQTGQRQADAARMFNMYTEFVGRARKFSNPSVNRYLYPQTGDPTQAAKIGMKASGGAQQ